MSGEGGESAAEDWSERQRDVLEAALRLIVEKGDALTMSAVARRASCSKETLYKWFGDRDGLLTATVKWQASKVRVPGLDRERPNLAALAASLTEFAVNWLTVIVSDTSVALNRLAISHAGSHKTDLGRIVLDHGRFEMGRRVKPVLEAGRAAGLIAFDDAEAAFRGFFGLVARDVQIRLLLGDGAKPTAAEIAHDAGEATRQFLALHGARAFSDPTTSGR